MSNLTLNQAENLYLTVCCGCLRVKRNGFWEEIDIREKNNLTHGICPSCTEKLYPELSIEGSSSDA